MVEDEREQRLRREAERLVTADRASLEDLTPGQLQDFIHELEVHRIELQMQNEELRSAQEELERSRKKYFGLFDLAPVGYLTLDRTGLILEANLKAGTLFGFPRSHLLQRNFRDFVVSSYWSALAEHLRAVGEQEEWRTCELELLNRNGSIFTAHLETIRVDEGDDEEAFGFRSAFVDITERKRAEVALRASEEALRQANEQLEEKVRERTAELVALNRDLMEGRDRLRSLATELALTAVRERRALASELHDSVAQTLAAAKLTLESMGPGGLEGKSAKGLQAVVKLIKQANRETRSLLSDLSLSPLYEDGLEAALRVLAQRMGELHSVPMEVLDDGSPKPLGEDCRIVLFRAVQELLTNAVKHAKATRVQVSLRRENRAVRIEVKDDGVGFLPSEVRSGTAKGECFGLFSIQERMQHLGGRFEIVSRPGEGVRAVLVAPLQMKEGEKAAPSRVRMLIVDDHRLMREGLRGFLEKQPGFEIVGEAANGLEAVHLTNEVKPDVVIMDINMPVMDGIEATRQIKQALPEVRVIGLTAYAENLVCSRALDAGASAFVLKGASPEELTEAIWSVVRSGQGR